MKRKKVSTGTGEGEGEIEAGRSEGEERRSFDLVCLLAYVIQSHDHHANLTRSSLPEDSPQPTAISPWPCTMASARSVMRLGGGRALASAVRPSRSCRGFSSTPLQNAKASSLPDPPNMRQAQRPRK